MTKKGELIIQIMVFIGIILILIGITIPMNLIHIFDITKKYEFLFVGLGMLCIVPKLYFPVKLEEQKSKSIDFIGRKAYVITAIAGLVLIVVFFF